MQYAYASRQIGFSRLVWPMLSVFIVHLNNVKIYVGENNILTLDYNIIIHILILII